MLFWSEPESTTPSLLFPSSLPTFLQESGNPSMPHSHKAPQQTSLCITKTKPTQSKQKRKFQKGKRIILQYDVLVLCFVVPGFSNAQKCNQVPDPTIQFLSFSNERLRTSGEVLVSVWCGGYIQAPMWWFGDYGMVWYGVEGVKKAETPRICWTWESFGSSLWRLLSM